MFLPHPHSKDPAQEPRQANPNRAVGAGVQCPSDGDEDPPLTPKRPGRGLQDEGWSGAQSQPGAVLALLAWSWRPAPVSQDTLPNPPKPAFCLRHPDVPYTLGCLR